MKFFKIGLILTAFSLFVFACTQTPTGNNSAVSNNTAVVVNSSNSVNNASSNKQNSTSSGELASSQKIYSEKCVKCHKEDGTGGITDIEGKKIKAPNFTSDRMKKESDSEFIEIIENGEKDDGMPAFKGKISDDDIKNLVKLIRRDFQGQK